MERHRFLTGFGSQKWSQRFCRRTNFLCRVCDTGKPDGACREAESIQKSSPRRQQSGFNKTTRRVGRMLFLMENAHCATAEDREQNGAKHFTVARRAIVTCFRRVMIVFAGICKGKLKIVTCFARQKSFIVFLAHEARYDFEFSLANASQINRNAPKVRYECAPRS